MASSLHTQGPAEMLGITGKQAGRAGELEAGGIGMVRNVMCVCRCSGYCRSQQPAGAGLGSLGTPRLQLQSDMSS